MKKALLAIGAVLMLCSGVAGADQPDFPATVAFRKAITGPGYVIVINTTIKQDIPATMIVTDNARGNVRGYDVMLSSKHPNEYGYIQKVQVSPGDEVELQNNYYAHLHVMFPR